MRRWTLLAAALLVATLAPARAADPPALPCLPAVPASCVIGLPGVCIPFLPCQRAPLVIPPGATVLLADATYTLQDDIIVQGTLLVRNATLVAQASGNQPITIDVQQGGVFDATLSTLVGRLTGHETFGYLNLDTEGGSLRATDSTLDHVNVNDAGNANLTRDALVGTSVSVLDAGSRLDAYDDVWSQPRAHDVDITQSGFALLAGNDFGDCLQNNECILANGGDLEMRHNTLTIPRPTACCGFEGWGIVAEFGSFTLVDNSLADDGDPLTHGIETGHVVSGVINGGSMSNFGVAVQFDDAASYAATTISGVTFSGNGQDVVH